MTIEFKEKDTGAFNKMVSQMNRKLGRDKFIQTFQKESVVVQSQKGKVNLASNFKGQSEKNSKFMNIVSDY